MDEKPNKGFSEEDVYIIKVDYKNLHPSKEREYREHVCNIFKEAYPDKHFIVIGKNVEITQL